MSRKGENIYKRKDGRWEGRYIKAHDIKGKAQYGYVYGKTYSSVKQLLHDKQCSASTVGSGSKNSSTLFECVLTMWLESQRINIKESTYARYHQIVHTHLIPDLGSIRVVKMTTSVIEKYVLQLLESGRINGKGGLSPKTVGDILTIIKAAVEYAKYNNWLIK